MAVPKPRPAALPQCFHEFIGEALVVVVGVVPGILWRVADAATTFHYFVELFGGDVFQ
jgi:hypothetical protein